MLDPVQPWEFENGLLSLCKHLKNPGDFTGIRTSDHCAGAVLHQLIYEATQLGAVKFVGFMCSRGRTRSMKKMYHFYLSSISRTSNIHFFHCCSSVKQRCKLQIYVSFIAVVLWKQRCKLSNFWSHSCIEPIPLHCSVMDQTLTTFFVTQLKRIKRWVFNEKVVKTTVEHALFGTISGNKLSGKVWWDDRHLKQTITFEIESVFRKAAKHGSN